MADFETWSQANSSFQFSQGTFLCEPSPPHRVSVYSAVSPWLNIGKILSSLDKDKIYIWTTYLLPKLDDIATFQVHQFMSSRPFDIAPRLIRLDLLEEKDKPFIIPPIKKLQDLQIEVLRGEYRIYRKILSYSEKKDIHWVKSNILPSDEGTDFLEALKKLVDYGKFLGFINPVNDFVDFIPEFNLHPLIPYHRGNWNGTRYSENPYIFSSDLGWFNDQINISQMYKKIEKLQLTFDKDKKKNWKTFQPITLEWLRNQETPRVIHREGSPVRP